MSVDAMWLLVLCHVTWCNAISCDVRSCDELSSVVPCNGMECYELKRSRCVVRSGSVTMRWSKVYSVLQSTTLNYKVLLQYYSVLQSTAPVLLWTTKYYCSTILYYKVLLQYYSVLQRTTPVLLCTTKYYSSTTLYYKVLQGTTPVLLCTTPVLLQYYSSTTPVLCTTKYYKVLLQCYSVVQSTTRYYSSTTKYYKELLQYCSVLQSTTPVLLCTTKYYNVLLKYYSSTTKYYSSSTLYYKVLLRTTKYYSSTALSHSWLIRITYETSFAMRGATGVSLQLHQILRLPHKMNLMIDPPAMQNESHDWSASHMKRHLQCAEQQESSSNFTKSCACHAKWISWLIFVTYETLFTKRGATLVTVQHHQILCLPRKMNLMIDLCHIWNVIYNARSNTGYRPTSPNIAPATKFWVQDLSEKSLNCFRQYKDNSTMTRR